MNNKYLLVLGFPSSGTSLLASFLGHHPKINMLFEDLGTAITKLYGKEYAGNKLVYPFQLSNKRNNKFYSMLNRIWRKLYNYNKFPVNKMTFDDYKGLGAKIIIIKRLPENNLRSFIEKSKMPKIVAYKMYNKAVFDFQNIDAYKLTLYQLTSDTENTLKGICKYLEIPYAKTMLDGVRYNYHKNRRTEIEKQR